MSSEIISFLLKKSGHALQKEVVW